MNKQYNLKEIFSNSKFFKEFDDTDFKLLEDTVEWKAIAKGEYLFKEGDEYNGFFLLCDGDIEIVKGNGNGDSETLAVLSEGEIFGELALFLSAKKRVASARGKTDGTCCFFPLKVFEHLLAEDNITAHRIVLSISRTLSKRLEHMNQELIKLMMTRNEACKPVNKYDLKKFKDQLLASWSF